MGQKQTLSVMLEHVPISFPLQQRCAEQPAANLGEGRQRERDGLYRSQWCSSICPRAWGEISALRASAPSIPNIWATLSADSQQCTQQGMEICTQQGVEISTRVAAQAKVMCRGPRGGSPVPTPNLCGGCKPPSSCEQPSSGSPSHHRQERSVLHWSMRGAPKQWRAQDDISSSAGQQTSQSRGRDGNTALPCGCQQDVGYAGWHGRRSGFERNR